MRHDGTLILTRSDIARLMRFSDYVAAVEQAFVRQAAGQAEAPAPMHIPGEGGGFHVKGAALSGAGHYVAVKINGNFPGNRAKHGLPTIQGAILLCDGKDGY